MDQIKHQKLPTLGEFNKSQFLKKAFQILLSLSIFSFLFSYSSLLSVFLHSFNFYFPTFPNQLFSYSIDRNYMFLLCNGILVIIVRNSGLIGSSPFNTDLHEEFITKKNRDGLQSISKLSETKEVVVENSGSLVEENGFLITQGEGDGNGSLSTEELNKKFDDFIKRMKEGIRIEAQQQLIMV